MASAPVIDSHIHLFPASELPTLAWCTPTHPLAAQHSVDEYLVATSSAHTPVQGFVFVETDRVCDLESDEGWKYPLEEVDWITRIALGAPRDGEGHTDEHKRLCLAIVPWAPVPNGRRVLRRYVAEVMRRAGDVRGKVVGFRYLVQYKPKRTMLRPGFIDGLKWLGEEGYSFDLGVDFRSGGVWQLEEAVEMMRLVNEGVREEKRVAVVINHMCKPNLRDEPDPELTFVSWKTQIQALAKFPNTYMKLSGAFSEINPLPSTTDQEKMSARQRQDMLSDLMLHIKPWVSEVVKLFNNGRLMFGSDWPVCNIGGGGNKVAWTNWQYVVGQYLEDAGVSAVDQVALWNGTAAKVYKISPKNEEIVK